MTQDDQPVSPEEGWREYWAGPSLFGMLILGGYLWWLMQPGVFPRVEQPYPWAFHGDTWAYVRGRADYPGGGKIEKDGRVICHAPEGVPVVFACPGLQRLVRLESCTPGQWSMSGFQIDVTASIGTLRINPDGESCQ